MQKITHNFNYQKNGKKNLYCITTCNEVQKKANQFLFFELFHQVIFCHVWINECKIGLVGGKGVGRYGDR